MGLVAALTAFYYFLKLSVQFVSIIVRAKYSLWRARRTFRRTLVLSGIPSESARKLASAYPNPMDGLFSLVRANRNRSS